VHTLCCGVAEVFSSHLSAREMMQQADAALYQAKEAGRNQTHMYDPANAFGSRRRNPAVNNRAGADKAEAKSETLS
jgi:predicted signal transduction protein with EAL and GGDEF domain